MFYSSILNIKLAILSIHERIKDKKKKNEYCCLADVIVHLM